MNAIREYGAIEIRVNVVWEFVCNIEDFVAVSNIVDDVLLAVEGDINKDMNVVLMHEAPFISLYC